MIKDNKEEVEKIVTKVNEIKVKIKNNEDHLLKVSNKLESILLNLPNNASTEVPIGKDETFNKLIFESKKFIKKHTL